jgi:isochorismate pyruvate lyase
LALLRFDISSLQFAFYQNVRNRTGQPIADRDHRFTGRAGSIASRAPSGGGLKGQALQGRRALAWDGPMTEILDPADCTTMTEVRAGVDNVDRQIVALLRRRFGYMDAAARIKPDRSAVRDEWRKADVLAKVDASAADLGVDRRLMARIYEDLIETSIAHEFEEFDRSRS